MPRDLTIGVLGGLGPQATLDFFAKVLELTAAPTDQDHLHLIIDNNPKVPNRNAAIAGDGPSAGPALAAMAGRLERAGAELLVMPCNTAHAFLGDIRAACALPFASIIDETIAELARLQPAIGRVGLLTAGGCRDARLYERALEAAGLRPVTTTAAQQADFMAALYAIKSGRRDESTRAIMCRLGEALIEAGAETVIAGCTEVPLVLADGDLSRPLIDSTAVLAAATVAYGKRRRPLPGTLSGAA